MKDIVSRVQVRSLNAAELLGQGILEGYDQT